MHRSRIVIAAAALSLTAALLAAVPAAPAQAVACIEPNPVSWSGSVPPAPGPVDTIITPGYYVVSNIWHYNSGDELAIWDQHPGVGSGPDWGFCSTTPNSGVQGYPEETTSVGLGGTLSSYSTITSAFTLAQTLPSGSTEETAYDLWWNDSVGHADATEVMVWVNNHGSTPAGSDTGTRVTDSQGHAYELWAFEGDGTTRGSIYTFVQVSNHTSETIGIRSLVSYLATHAPYDNSNTGNPSGIGTNPTAVGFDFGAELGQNSGTMTWEDDSLSYNIS
jgi:hypothetical protein